MATPEDIQIVAELLGREPQGEFEVILRRNDNSPVVLKNQPLLYSGRPMPTMYWLVDPALNKSIGRVESHGGVVSSEKAVDPDEIILIHNRYEQDREKLLDPLHQGPKPTGGVGGTRRGVKCLHAHYANYLITQYDAIGHWTQLRLQEIGQEFIPSQPGILSRENLDE